MIQEILISFFGGAFLGNSIPHIVSGATGKRFPEKDLVSKNHFLSKPLTIFTTPTVNVIWGFLNLSLGLWFLEIMLPFTLTNTILAISGAFLVCLFLAVRMGNLNYKNKSKIANSDSLHYK